MSGATVEGKKAVVELRKGTVTMQGLESATGTTTRSLVGAKIAATAFNMAITMGISIAITKIIMQLARKPT